MLTVTPTRPAAPSLSLTPSKRQKTPSPQKPLQKGIFTPATTERFADRLKSLQSHSITTLSPAIHDIDVTFPTDDSHDTSFDGTREAPQTYVSADEKIPDLTKTSDETAPVTMVLPITDKYPRKIVMPFSLLNQNNSQRSPTIDESAEIMALFPGCTSVKHIPPYLIIVLKPVPTIPLPTSIAGIPIYFTDDTKDLGPVAGSICRGAPIRRETRFTLWEIPDFKERISILEELLPLGVRALGWIGTRWLLYTIAPESDNVADKLPRAIGNMVATFLPYKTQDDRSLRQLTPTANAYDNSNYYPHLHAGMMISDTEVFTTTGVPVVHPSCPNARYFSVAEQGFRTMPGVIHPSIAVGHVIGQVWKSFQDTDIAIAKITDPAVRFSAETFAGPHGTMKLDCLVSQSETYMGQELFMDSPFTGLANGYVYVSDVAAIPTDDNVHPWAYVANLWVDFENDLKDPVNGCCGSPMFDSEGGVHAFFRYYADDSGISYCPTPDPLINAGYELMKSC